MTPEQLHAALNAVPASAWSKPSTFAATRVHHGYRQVSMVAAGRRGAAAEPFRFALDEFEPVWSAWLSWIEPGGFIVSHIDAGPHRERWQIPITTAGTLNDVTAVDGFPFRVTHWEPHEVTNDTDRPRIHLVLDRDVIIRPAPARFSICKET